MKKGDEDVETREEEKRCIYCNDMIDDFMVSQYITRDSPIPENAAIAICCLVEGNEEGDLCSTCYDKSLELPKVQRKLKANLDDK